MATTNWDNVDAMQAVAPHTFNALQHLVVAMAKVVKYRGKKSLFGKDKGLAAYKTYEEKLKDTLFALVLDNQIARNAPAQEARLILMDAIATFEAAFPNWQDAYGFAIEYFVDDASSAEERITAIMA